ncbi:exo-alpha-sialidase [Plantactinospora sp. S1510]|uniref:Exo-alpha-sialidase n=1 Tax=Plantactinospora alkalitolerans TaxID=2789879 RepID=A0ABS0GTX0_9ACTN|nr:sialidase family protein [Plantactinospora alkalitolerans]MBF9129652.1 exo-alpha-sialidase [Plantactinospora alkalitolerans]
MRFILRRATAALATSTLALAAAPAAATAAEPPPTGTPTNPVIVAAAESGKRAFFGDMIKLRDGRLLVAYRESVAHINQDGRIMVVQSRDQGRTWTAPLVAIDTPIDDRDPKLMQMRDGTVLMNFFRTDWTGYPGKPITLVGTFVTRSTDQGGTWSTPSEVGTAMEGPSDVVVGAYYAGHAATHGPILQLRNGDLLVPLYGRLPEGGTGPATVVRSTDGGRTWPRENESVIGRADTFDFQEPNLSLLKDGSILSVIRTSINVAYVSRSYDGGRVWTTPVSTGLPASSHHQLVLHNGDLLLTYGDLSGTFGPGRPTVGRLLQHPERDLDAQRDILIYDAAVHGPATADQANPSSVELRPNRFFTITSDPHLAAIVGVYTGRHDYLR